MLRAGEACYVGGRVRDEGQSLTLEAKGKAQGLGSDTIEDVSCVLDATSAPDYVRQHINSTRALDGQQEDSWAGVKARWTYHPDTGLQITLVDDGTWPLDTDIPKAVKAPLESCRAVLGDGGPSSVMQRIPAVINELGSTMSPQQVDEMQEIHSALDQATEGASPALEEALRELDTPFRQLSEQADQGGGDVNLDTGKVKSALPTVMGLCAKAGYEIDKDG